MLPWLINNYGTILVSLALIGIISAIIRKMIQDKKAGVHSCGCSCSQCGTCSSCHGSCGSCGNTSSIKR